MDKIEKIRKKIEALLNDWKYGSSTEAKYRCEVYQELLKDIDNIEEDFVNDRFTFNAIPRLLEMIEPTDRAKAYISKLADTLDVEGYSTDAKIVRESLKTMNGEKVAMATMDDEPVNGNLEECIDFYEKLIGGFENMSNHDCRNVARYFADWGERWQKEQMMKDAVDGFVIEDIEEGNGDFLLSTDYLPKERGFKDQQKVKVIILKDE